MIPQTLLHVLVKSTAAKNSAACPSSSRWMGPTRQAPRPGAAVDYYFLDAAAYAGQGQRYHRVRGKWALQGKPPGHVMIFGALHKLPNMLT